MYTDNMHTKALIDSLSQTQKNTETYTKAFSQFIFYTHTHTHNLPFSLTHTISLSTCGGPTAQWLGLSPACSTDLRSPTSSQAMASLVVIQASQLNDGQRCKFPQKHMVLFEHSLKERDNSYT